MVDRKGSAQSSDIVVLNVGGRLFTTTRTTLTTYPHSMLAGMFRGDVPAGSMYDGGIFIDRDPTWFPTILTFLRDGCVPLPSSSLERQQLRAEAAFYSLTELVAAVDDAEAARADDEAAEVAQRQEAARARDFLAKHRAELLHAALEVLKREEAALRELRGSLEAVRAAQRQLEERARRLNGALPGALVAPGEPDEAAQELDRLQGEAARLATMAEETGAQIRAAEQRLRTARLAHICSLSIELPAAQVLMAALHPM